jgi:hypothetical protein
MLSVGATVLHFAGRKTVDQLSGAFDALEKITEKTSDIVPVP